jgi:hypothetical protein
LSCGDVVPREALYALELQPDGSLNHRLHASEGGQAV